MLGSCAWIMSVPYSDRLTITHCDCVINQIKFINNLRSSNIKNYKWSVTEPEVMGHVIKDNVDEFVS